jgi:hypothetical protein
LFDEERDTSEYLARTFVAELRDGRDEEGRSVMRMSLNEQPLGSELTDNAHDPDGYRFHDILHLSLVAKLGWSPVIRALLKLTSPPVMNDISAYGVEGLDCSNQNPS